MNPLPRFVVLYAAIYAAYGVASPFLPSFLGSRGLSAEEVGLALGAGTAVRLVAAPLASRIGDRLRALQVVLAITIALAACATLGYISARAFWAVLTVVLLQAAALAPMTGLADALALGASRRRPGFEYGWVRGSRSSSMGALPRPIAGYGSSFACRSSALSFWSRHWCWEAMPCTTRSR